MFCTNKQWVCCLRLIVTFGYFLSFIGYTNGINPVDFIFYWRICILFSWKILLFSHKSLKICIKLSPFFLLQHIWAIISCYWHIFIKMWPHNLSFQFCHIQFEKVAELWTRVAELWSLHLVQKGLVVPLLKSLRHCLTCFLVVTESTYVLYS